MSSDVQYNRYIEQVDDKGISLSSGVIIDSQYTLTLYAEYNYDTSPVVSFKGEDQHASYAGIFASEMGYLHQLCMEFAFWGKNKNAVDYPVTFWDKLGALDTLHNGLIPVIDSSDEHNTYKSCNQDVTQQIRTAYDYFMEWGSRKLRINSDLWVNIFGDSFTNKYMVSKWLTYKQVPGYIYLVKGLYETPTYKIGYSKTPKKRIRKFDVVLPFPIETTHLIKTDHMKAVEAYLHDKYKDRRSNGEWFELTPDDVAEICAIETLNAEDIA